MFIAPIVQDGRKEIGVSAGRNIREEITSNEIASIGNPTVPKGLERALLGAG